MVEDQVMRLNQAIENGEKKTTRFTLDEFMELINKLAESRNNRRRRGYE